MSEKISIACPHCKKRYSVPADIGDRKVKCKACKNAFHMSEALRLPRKSQASQKPLVSGRPQVDGIKGTTPVRNEPAFNLDGVFKESVGNASGAVSSNFQQAPNSPAGPIWRQRSNPRMVLAIVGSILVCVLLMPICFIVNAMLLAAMVPPDAAPIIPANNSSRVQSRSIAEEANPLAEKETPVTENKKRVVRNENRAPKNKTSPPVKKTYTKGQRATAKLARLSPRDFERNINGSLIHIRLDNEGLLEHGAGAKDAALLDDRLFLASSNALLIYDWKTKTELCYFDKLDQFKSVQCIAIDPMGTKLLVGGQDNDRRGIIELFDVDEVGQITPVESNFRRGNHKFLHLTFSPNGEKFASGDGGKRLTFWDVDSQKQFRYGRPINSFDIAEVKSNAEGTAVLVICRGEWSSWSWEDGKQISNGIFSDQGANASAGFSNGRRIATALRKKFFVYELGNVKPIFQTDMDEQAESIAVLSDTTVATLNKERLTCWDLSSDQQSKTYELGCHSIEKVVVSRDGTKVAIIAFSDVYMIDLNQ